MAFQVKDCMTKKLQYLSPDMNAEDAMKKLLDLRMSGLPVIDESGKLHGVFTEKEILKSILPVYIKNVGAFIYADNSKAEIRKIAELGKFAVKDIMRKETVVITEEASLTEASRVMLTKSERRLMVVKDGKVVGVITRADVVLALAKEAKVIS